MVENVNSIKRFFDEFTKSNSEENVPHRSNILSRQYIEPEDVQTEVLDWCMHYLEQKKCPHSLALILAKLVAHQLSDSVFEMSLQAEEGIDDKSFRYQTSQLYIEMVDCLLETCKNWQEHVDTNSAKVDPLPNVVSVCAIKNGRRKMEDRHVILHDLNILCGLKDVPHHSYYAVFDGHAGVEAASYCAAHLHWNIVNHPSFLTNTEKAICEAIALTDKRFLECSYREGIKGGCTALCCLIRDKDVYIAWVGDSQAVLVRNGMPTFIGLPHKSDREEERQRIEELGGCVLYIDTWRVNGILTVSRALGNLEHKPYISSEAEVVKIPLDGTEDYIVLACDGLWDRLLPLDLSAAVYQHIMECKSADKVALKLVEISKNLGSNDNITAIVIFLKNPSTISTPTLSLPQTVEANDWQINGTNPDNTSIKMNNADLPEGTNNMMRNEPCNNETNLLNLENTYKRLEADGLSVDTLSNINCERKNTVDSDTVTNSTTSSRNFDEVCNEHNDNFTHDVTTILPLSICCSVSYDDEQNIIDSSSSIIDFNTSSDEAVELKPNNSTPIQPIHGSVITANPAVPLLVDIIEDHNSLSVSPVNFLSKELLVCDIKNDANLQSTSEMQCADSLEDVSQNIDVIPTKLGSSDDRSFLLVNENKYQSINVSTPIQSLDRGNLLVSQDQLVNNAKNNVSLNSSTEMMCADSLEDIAQHIQVCPTELEGCSDSRLHITKNKVQSNFSTSEKSSDLKERSVGNIKNNLNLKPASEIQCADSLEDISQSTQVASTELSGSSGYRSPSEENKLKSIVAADVPSPTNINSSSLTDCGPPPPAKDTYSEPNQIVHLDTLRHGKTEDSTENNTTQKCDSVQKEASVEKFRDKLVTQNKKISLAPKEKFVNKSASKGKVSNINILSKYAGDNSKTLKIKNSTRNDIPSKIKPSTKLAPSAKLQEGARKDTVNTNKGVQNKSNEQLQKEPSAKSGLIKQSKSNQQQCVFDRLSVPKYPIKSKETEHSRLNIKATQAKSLSSIRVKLTAPQPKHESEAMQKEPKIKVQQRLHVASQPKINSVPKTTEKSALSTKLVKENPPKMSPIQEVKTPLPKIIKKVNNITTTKFTKQTTAGGITTQTKRNSEKDAVSNTVNKTLPSKINANQKTSDNTRSNISTLQKHPAPTVTRIKNMNDGVKRIRKTTDENKQNKQVDKKTKPTTSRENLNPVANANEQNRT